MSNNITRNNGGRRWEAGCCGEREKRKMLCCVPSISWLMLVPYTYPVCGLSSVCAKDFKQPNEHADHRQKSL